MSLHLIGFGGGIAKEIVKSVVVEIHRTRQSHKRLVIFFNLKSWVVISDGWVFIKMNIASKESTDWRWVGIYCHLVYFLKRKISLKFN